jgi:hypothetical protein
MRHNYVGDEGDYAKLALLNALRAGHTLGVNWYLTDHEETRTKAGAASAKGDGNKRAHLDNADDWRYLDAVLLERMVESLREWTEEDRHISGLEAMLDGAVFFGEALPTGAVPLAERVAARGAWHERALDALRGADIVFIDPDNGFQVKSRGPRSKWRCKYALYSEVSGYLARGQAVVAYQHQPRATWSATVEKVRADMAAHGVRMAPPAFIAFGSRGFFLMSSDPRRVAAMLAVADGMRARMADGQWTKFRIEVIPPA